MQLKANIKENVKMKLTAAVIGCGNISKFHFSGLEKTGAKIKWVCDLRKESAKPWMEKFNAKYTDDFMDIMNDPEVIVVNITSFSSIHKDMCLAAIDAGKSVICEKTLTTNAEDSYEIVKKAEKAGTIFYTSYMKRFLPAVEKGKEILPSIGKILSTSIRAFQPWGDMWSGNPKEGACHTPPGGKSVLVKNLGGGVLVCGGSHILDLVCHFLGRPSSLYAYMAIPKDRDYDLQAAALMETENGPVHYETLMHSLDKIGYLRDGWDETIEITGTKGRINVYCPFWDKVDIKGSLMVHCGSANGTATEYRFAPVSPFDRAIAFFCENISKGKQGTQSRLTGYDVDELISCITKSAKSKKALEIKWKI